MEAWVSLLAGSRAAVARRGGVPGGPAEVSRAKAALVMLEAGAWAVYEASVHTQLVGAARLAAQLAAEEVCGAATAARVGTLVFRRERPSSRAPATTERHAALPSRSAVLIARATLAIAACAQVVDEGEEDETDAERHAALAMLGRARPTEAAALLTAALDERTAHLRAHCEQVASGQSSAHGGAALEALLEELDVLLQVHAARAHAPGESCTHPQERPVMQHTCTSRDGASLASPTRLTRRCARPTSSVWTRTPVRRAPPRRRDGRRRQPRGASRGGGRRPGHASGAASGQSAARSHPAAARVAAERTRCRAEAGRQPARGCALARARRSPPVGVAPVCEQLPDA
eukprot:5637639-Prymnesium_polylepis.1